MVKEITLYSMMDKHRLYLRKVVTELGKLHGRNLTKMSLYKYLTLGGRIAVYEQGDEVKGITLSRGIESIWDGTHINYVDLIYGETPRASFALLNDLIDFTKTNAKAMIIARNEFTRIHSKSFIKRGFKKLEEQYVMEI